MHSRNLTYPVASEYQKSFLDFVASLFSKSEEPDLRNEIVALKREIVQNAPGGCTFKTYFIQKEKCITLMESKTNVDENHATTGLWTTSASLILSDWLQHHHRFVDGCSIVELGCGCGFVGISLIAAAAKRETAPKKYVFTDLHPQVLAQCEQNVTLNREEINETGVKLEYRSLNWEEMQPSNWDFPFEVVLGADIVYDPKYIPALVVVVKHFLTMSWRKCQMETRLSQSTTKVNRGSTQNEDGMKSMSSVKSITNHDKKMHVGDKFAEDKLEDVEDQDGTHANSLGHNCEPRQEPAAFFVFAIRETATMQFFLLCARNFGLQAVDLEEIEDRDWEFPDRDVFHSSDRDADFKMIRITNDLSEEERQIILLN